jgi:hypothetical protein
MRAVFDEHRTALLAELSDRQQFLQTTEQMRDEYGTRIVGERLLDLRRADG